MPDANTEDRCIEVPAIRRYRLLLCEVFYREFCLAAARSPHAIDLEFIPQGLHNKPSGEMRAEMQRRVDAVPPGCEAILLGYGLCNNGLAGVKAPRVPLVIPRAHDCITFYLGSRARYEQVFKEVPGTYYLTSGWMERTGGKVEGLHDPNAAAQDDARYRQYVEKFGEEEAKYLMETLGSWQQNYVRMLFIDLGLGQTPALREAATRYARTHGLRFEETRGDMRLFDALVAGPPWDDKEFLVVPPGHAIQPSYDGGVIEARPVP